MNPGGYSAEIVRSLVDLGPGSTFPTRQTELVEHGRWPGRRYLTTAIFGHIEGFYKRRRRHATLGYLSLKDYEEVTLDSKRVTEREKSEMVAP